jgi:hypothetical protein
MEVRKEGEVINCLARPFYIAKRNEKKSLKNCCVVSTEEEDSRSTCVLAVPGDKPMVIRFISTKIVSLN